MLRVFEKSFQMEFSSGGEEQMRIYLSSLFMMLSAVLSNGPAVAVTPTATVEAWCKGASLRSNLSKLLSEDAVKAKWLEIGNLIAVQGEEKAFLSARKLLQEADPKTLSNLFISVRQVGKAEETRKVPLYWVLLRLRIHDLLHNDRKKTLDSVCQLFRSVRAGRPGGGDTFDLNQEVEFVAELLSSHGFVAQAETLYRFGLERTKGEEGKRCSSVFIGRRLCSGLVRTLVIQKRYADAAKHIENMLKGVESDVGFNHPDYFIGIDLALSVAEGIQGDLDPFIELLSVLNDALQAASEAILKLDHKSSQYADILGLLVKDNVRMADLFEGVDRKEAKKHSSFALDGSILLALHLSGEGNEVNSERLQGAVGAALYLSKELNRPLRHALLTEWHSRLQSSDLFKNAPLQRRDTQSSDQGWVNFTHGLVEFESIIRTTPTSREANVLTRQLLEAVVDYVEQLQGRFHSQTLAARMDVAKYDVWSGDGSSGRKAGSLVVERMTQLMSLDLKGWETWQYQLEGWRDFLVWYRDLLLFDIDRKAIPADQLKQALQVSQLLRHNRSSWALTALAARENQTESVKVLLKRHAQLYDSIFEIERCMINFNICPSSVKPHEARRSRDAVVLEVENLSNELKKIAPQYATIATPQLLSPDEIAATLKRDEVFVMFDWDKSGIVTFVVTPFDGASVRRASSSVGREATRLVHKLRCGLDRAAWEMKSPFNTEKLPARAKLLMRETCFNLTGEAAPSPDRLPFDLSSAYDLYGILLKPLELEIEGKRLIVVATGPLSSLPLSVLVTKKPAAGVPSDLSGYSEAKWLGLEAQLSLVPSPSALKSLRSERPSEAHAGSRRAYVAFANPAIDGDPADGRVAFRLKDSRRKDKCSSLGARAATSTNPAVDITATFFKGGRANGSAIRQQMPLPESADEVCEIASVLKAPDGDIYLGDRMTEEQIRSLSDTGELKQFDIVHFSTHALLPRETQKLTERLTEPALILSPPKEGGDAGNAANDGLLTASEIAALRMDADWVILSACNTAAGQSDTSEALSGLANSFFLAGARTILVSHWYVDAEASKRIITGALSDISENKMHGRAEGLLAGARAVVKMGDLAAHPMYWAPFSIVGEGAK
ncbi:CHAT domain-containing protein [Bradyrhizobium sp. RT6a]|uniref:CHAT domain-containing protein n=1 Tax=Bradyrhizobium sp. RT6a TaxID=3156381 RepID=UPI00339A3E2A